MKTINVKGELKEQKGTKVSKNLRKEGRVPCVLYGGEENIHFTTTPNDVKDLIYTNKIYTVDLEVDGKNYKALLKDAQFHPVTDAIVHLDFQQLIEDREVKLQIPVEFVGTAKGVQEGGHQITKLRKLQVKTLPKFLKESIEIDVTSLTLGQSIRVRDLDIEGLEIQNSPANPIVSVQSTRVSKAALELEAIEATEEAEGEAGEGEGEGAEAEAKGETAEAGAEGEGKSE